MTINPEHTYTSDGKLVAFLHWDGTHWVGHVGDIQRTWNEIGEQVNANGQVMQTTQNYLKRVHEEGDE